MSETDGDKGFAANLMDELDYVLTAICINHSEATAFRHVFKAIDRIKEFIDLI